MDNTKEPPKSTFGRRSTAEEVTSNTDLTGQTVLITGCNSGLGFESMRVLSRCGAHIIGLSRTRQKAVDAAAEAGADITPIACELSDFDSVVAATREIDALDRPIDVVMCNAGIMALPELQTKYGLELQFVTNHLGHFILVNRLLGRLQEAASGRVVMVSSLGHLSTVTGGINFDNLSGDKGYTPFTFYGQSKLANLLMSNELSKRMAGTRVTSNAIHPGVIMTPLMRNLGSFKSTLTSLLSLPISKSVQQGAATQCYVASAPELDGVSGYYFSNCNRAIMSIHAKNQQLAERLWQYSEEVTSNYLHA